MTREDKSVIHNKNAINELSKFTSSKKGSLMEKKNRTEFIKAISVNKRKQMCTWMTNKVRSFDIYGQKVNFTYKGHKSY